MSQSEEADALRNGFLNLPNELFIDILAYLTKGELKPLRLVCSRLLDVTTPLLFTTAIIAARRGVFDAFVALSKQPELSRHVVELIYDGSWFGSKITRQYRSTEGPPSEIVKLVSKEGRDKYMEAFDEQEKILAHELAPTIRRAIKDFTSLRRLIYMNFANPACFHWDRVEDLGPGTSLQNDVWTNKKFETSFDSPLFLSLCTSLSKRRRYFGLALLLAALSQPDCKTQIIDLRIGDGAHCRGAGGIPDTLFLALSDGSYGPSSAFGSLRSLDLTISECTAAGHPGQQFPYFPHLELLRLVGPRCSPTEMRYAPPLREPAIEFPGYCGNASWPSLRALELKWISFKANDFLNFLDRHRDTLRFINLYEIYISERCTWPHIVRTLHSMYPALVIEPYKRFHRFPWYETLILNFTLYNGESILTNTGIPLGADWSLDDYDEDKVSSHNGDKDVAPEDMYSSDSSNSSFDVDFDYDEEYESLQDPL